MDLGYTGPLAVGTDETVCVKSLCIEGSSLVGAQGGDISFDSTEELKHHVQSILDKGQMCSKVFCSSPIPFRSQETDCSIRFLTLDTSLYCPGAFARNTHLSDCAYS